ncbi:hypothetical protein [Xanthomonas arboricola]|uniref:hypothetical protein n=1 Tax=Xanthomonas arboricola TaxID=56448 RepID=UPI000F8F2551|nr:hypothetical protein [Xanthomonas arboricola]CAD2243158.1 hypothetical protein X12_000395 [Xanthomonas arboricola]
MVQFYFFAVFAWGIFWVLPGFIHKTILTSATAAIIGLAAVIIVALATDKYWKPQIQKLPTGWPRYKAQFKGFACILAAAFFTQLLHYQMVHR